MKSTYTLYALAFCSIFSLVSSAEGRGRPGQCRIVAPNVEITSLKESVDLSQGWRYFEGDDPVYFAVDFDDSKWGTTALPTRILRRNRKGYFWLRKRFLFRGNLEKKLGLYLGSHAGKVWVYLNGRALSPKPFNGPPLLFLKPPVVKGENVIAIRVKFGTWHGGLKWREKPRLGPMGKREHGFFECSFLSSADGTPQPYGLYIPQTYDGTRAYPLIVGLHGMNGDIYSFIYSNILDYAEKEGYILIFPYARGNALYIRKAEDDVMDAIDDVSKLLKIDGQRVSLVGFSMGGTGALTTAYHYPHRFAATVGIMGDSLYSYRLGSYYRYYSRRIFRSVTAEKRYSIKYFPENALHMRVWMFQGRNDRVSPSNQVRFLRKAERRRGRKFGIHFQNRIELIPGYDHEEELMHVKMKEIFDFIRGRKAPRSPERVIYTSNSNGFRRNAKGRVKKGQYNRAYWLQFRLRKARSFGTAEVVKNACSNTIEIRRLTNVSKLLLDLEAMKLDVKKPIILENWPRSRITVKLALKPGQVIRGEHWWGPRVKSRHRGKTFDLYLAGRSAVRLTFTTSK